MARTAPVLTSITTDQGGRPLDVATMVASVDRWSWIRIGVAPYAADWVAGASEARTGLRNSRGAFLVVRLAVDDTYSLEIGRVARRSFEWRPLAQVRGVHGDGLARALDALYVEALDG